MRDTIAGRRAIIQKITKYLPVPPGLTGIVNFDVNQLLQTGSRNPEQNRYAFYASFAEYPELVSPILNAIQGTIHEKPPTIELPDDMQYLLDTATTAGDTLEELWEIATREIFSVGRFSILSEVVNDRLLFAPYVAESLINWWVLPKLAGGGPVFVVFEETHKRPSDTDRYVLEDKTIWRELELVFAEVGEPFYRVRLWIKTDSGEVAVKVDDTTDEHGWIVPTLLGKPFPVIPVTVINAIQRGFKFGSLPLIQPSRRSLSIFRRTADYNRALYNKGDPQAVLFGISADEAPDKIGGGSIWCFENESGTAAYLDIDGDGIPLMREGINDQYMRIGEEVGRLFDGGDTTGPESGEAIRRRAATQQVTVKSAVINAGTAFENALRWNGRLMGKSDEAVAAIKFTPNTDFAEPMMSGQELLGYVMSKNAGAVLSDESIHDIARRHKITDKTFDEEKEAIEAEGPDLTALPPPLPFAEETDGDGDGDDGAGDGA